MFACSGMNLRTFTRNGNGYFLHRPSEVSQFSMSARATIHPLCGIVVKDGARPPVLLSVNQAMASEPVVNGTNIIDTELNTISQPERLSPACLCDFYFLIYLTQMLVCCHKSTTWPPQWYHGTEPECGLRVYRIEWNLAVDSCIYRDSHCSIIYSLGRGLCTRTVVSNSKQLYTLCGMVK